MHNIMLKFMEELVITAYRRDDLNILVSHPTLSKRRVSYGLSPHWVGGRRPAGNPLAMPSSELIAREPPGD